jgi:hypothetical protein
VTGCKPGAMLAAVLPGENDVTVSGGGGALSRQDGEAILGGVEAWNVLTARAVGNSELVVEAPDFPRSGNQGPRGLLPGGSAGGVRETHTWSKKAICFNGR